jgi:hypothetical protein
MEQHVLRSRLPGDVDLFPERVVVVFTGLRAEHGDLPLDEELPRRKGIRDVCATGF